VTALRVAGEGDLLAQLDRLRKVLDGEGLFAPQKALASRRCRARSAW
jgi:exonuclease VII large subunit